MNAEYVREIEWPMMRLGDVAAVNPRRPKIERPDDAPTTFVPMPAVDGDLGAITDALSKPFGAVKKGYTYFEEGDVIFAKITPCMQNGKHAIARDLVGGIGFGSTEFHVLRPGPTVTAEWIWLFLRRRSLLEELSGQLVGSVGQQRLPEPILSNIEIPVPSVPEQRRVASEAMVSLSELDEAEGLARRSAGQRARLERAVIDLAFGALGDVPTEEVALGDVADIRSGLTKGRKMTGVPSERPFLRAANLGNARLNLDEIKTIPATDEEAERFRLEDGDVLLVEGSGSPARLAQGWVWEGQIESCLHQNHVFRVRPDRARVDPYYLAWLLQGTPARDYFLGAAKTTSGLNTINRTQVAAYRFPLPSLTAQQELVARLSAQVEDVRHLALGWTDTGQRLERMRAALLDQSFRGDF
jgi:type I restriction enzyme, S subunit